MMDQATIAFVVKDQDGVPVEGAYCHIVETQMCGHTNQDGYHSFDYINVPKVYTLEVNKDGYDFYAGSYEINGNTDIPIQLHRNVAPPSDFHPTRDQIIHVNGNLCNLRDNDDYPIFDCYIGTLILEDLNKAEDWLARLRMAGTTSVNLNLSWDYDQHLSWIERYPIVGKDWTNDVTPMKECLDWLLSNKMIPHVHLAADGQDYDPVGWTYGHPWAMEHTPKILPKLEDYFTRCLWNAGWDGCFPNWSPQQFDQYYKMLRSIVGKDAQIAAEFGGPPGATIGYIHLGNDVNDWKVGGPLDVLDVFCTELQEWPLSEENGIQQVAARLLGPGKKNIQPSNDGPYYIPGDRPRGELGVSYWETMAYWAMRKYATPQDAVISAQVGQKYGFKDFGNGLP